MIRGIGRIAIGACVAAALFAAEEKPQADLVDLRGDASVEMKIPEGAPELADGGSAVASGQSVNVDSETISNMYPLDRTPGLKTKNPALMQDAFEMEIDREVVNRVLKQQRRYERLMGGVHDVALLQKPITRPFSAIDTIRVTTEYMTTVVFPKNYKIQYAKSTDEFIINEFDQNVLLIQPKRDFQSGSIAIGMSDGKNNTVVNIIVEKYLPGDVLHDQVEGRVLSCGEYISTMIRYIDRPKIKPIEVIKKYFALYGDTAIKRFKTSGSFDVMTIGGMPFYIIRDEKYGTVDYKNISFRVDSKYEQFVERQRAKLQVGGKL